MTGHNSALAPGHGHGLATGPSYPAAPDHRLLRAIAARCSGPGGYYNLGHALGLVAGIAFQFLGAQGGTTSSVAAIVRDYLVGSPGATALSMAMIIFFVSGEMYHRAWTGRTLPETEMLRRADFICGVGVLVFAVALVSYGGLWLALAATILRAGGKFGNALAPAGCWRVRFELVGRDGSKKFRQLDLFRAAALLSRIPAIAAVLVEIARLLAVATPVTALDLGQPVVLFICYCLWIRADLLLFRH